MKTRKEIEDQIVWLKEQKLITKSNPAGVNRSIVSREITRLESKITTLQWVLTKSETRRKP